MLDPRIRVYDGTLIDPFDPDPKLMRAENFLHASSIVNRYAGNTQFPYSIAQHSMNLAMMVPTHLCRAALIHDWAECWFQDMPQPIKVQFPDYKKAEHEAMLKIGKRFNVSEEEFKELDPYDKNIYMDERNSMMTVGWDTGMGDDREGLGCPEWMFREITWRAIRENNTTQFYQLFPEYRA